MWRFVPPWLPVWIVRGSESCSKGRDIFKKGDILQIALRQRPINTVYQPDSCIPRCHLQGLVHECLLLRTRNYHSCTHYFSNGYSQGRELVNCKQACSYLPWCECISARETSRIFFANLKAVLRLPVFITRGCVYSQIVYHILIMYHRLCWDGYHPCFQRTPNHCGIPRNKDANLAAETTYATAFIFNMIFSRTDAPSTIRAATKHAYSSLGALLNYRHIYPLRLILTFLSGTRRPTDKRRWNPSRRAPGGCQYTTVYFHQITLSPHGAVTSVKYMRLLITLCVNLWIYSYVFFGKWV